MAQGNGVAGREGDGRLPWLSRLSSRLLLLTIAFVMIAEVLIFLPSVAHYRFRWLEQQLSTAAAASIVILRGEEMALPREVQDELLEALGARAIAVRDQGSSRLLAMAEMPPPNVDLHVSMADTAPFKAIGAALDTMFNGGDRIMRVFGTVGGSDTEFELVMSDTELRKALLTYSKLVAILSFFISLITAALVYFAIHSLMIRRIGKLRSAMAGFAEAPHDPSRIILPGERRDELGMTEREMAAMQRQLHRTLGEQKHLADLGLAVSKINHELRNMLASAQLLSDRLQMVEDPSVQVFAPKLVRTLDRAVGYTENVLSYGRAQEPPPSRRRVRLRLLVEEVEGLLGIEPDSGIEFANKVDPLFEIDADAEQLFRVLSNLCRNAHQAMSGDQEGSVVKRITVVAERTGSVARIVVEDTGPGLPPKARENLFAAFRGSARSGGTGLGLAIVQELVRAHDGTIELVESVGGRTVFAITIPDQAVQLEQARRSMKRPA